MRRFDLLHFFFLLFMHNCREKKRHGLWILKCFIIKKEFIYVWIWKYPTIKRFIYLYIEYMDTTIGRFRTKDLYVTIFKMS